MKRKLFSLFSLFKRSLDKNTVVGVATYANTVNAVCLKKSMDTGKYTNITV